jgi:uncharacterized membrane protein (DUF485 family)
MVNSHPKAWSNLCKNHGQTSSTTTVIVVVAVVVVVVLISRAQACLGHQITGDSILA